MFRTLFGGLLLAAALPAGAACPAAGRPATLVELYTSEGCSSCPPADRWLSTLKGRDDVLAMAFHVDYWDRLGWRDRFASPAATQRQYRLAEAAGSRSVYTPQVLVDGRDWRGWPRLPPPALGGTPRITLQRDGDAVLARIDAAAAGAQQLGAWWAVLEDGHASHVSAGENRGERLRHDHVVRLYQPLQPWPAARGATLRLALAAGVAEHPRRAALVITDAASQRPLAAAVLPLPPGC